MRWGDQGGGEREWGWGLGGGLAAGVGVGVGVGGGGGIIMMAADMAMAVLRDRGGIGPPIHIRVRMGVARGGRRLGGG